MTFADSSIPTETLFDGAALPKTLRPANPTENGADALAEAVRNNGRHLSSLLRNHGAVLFRGFDVAGVADFRRVVEAFGWEDMPYLGGAPRIKVEDTVFTANEAPLDQFIKFHHEMALMREMPSKVFFFCQTPPAEGGATSLARSDVLLREMERRVPEFVRRLPEAGIVIEIEYPEETVQANAFGTSWKSVLQTDDPSLAKQRAYESMKCSTFEIDEDGNAKVQYGPLPVVETHQGKKIWLINIDVPEARMADGNPIPLEALLAFRNSMDAISVDVEWQKGDVLLVDNLSTLHARKPGKPPRKVLVSICK